jgi:hypothetical protein
MRNALREDRPVKVDQKQCKKPKIRCVGRFATGNVYCVQTHLGVGLVEVYRDTVWSKIVYVHNGVEYCQKFNEIIPEALITQSVCNLQDIILMPQ